MFKPALIYLSVCAFGVLLLLLLGLPYWVGAAITIHSIAKGVVP